MIKDIVGRNIFRETMWLFLLTCAAGFLPSITAAVNGGNSWNRSALIYHMGNRNQDNWKRHLLRIEENGAYTNKWLFDHAILTAEDIIATYGAKIVKVLQDLLQDAKDIDAAMPRRNTKFQLSIGCPIVDNFNGIIKLDGVDYNTSKMDQRLGVLKWYVRKINEFRLSNTLKYSEIYGVYYHNEHVIAGNGDVPLVIGFNNYVHELGMKSVWIPYYNSPGGFDGRAKLEFDVVNVQPSYSFSSAIDGNVAKGDRLYSSGFKSAELDQCYEYEIRSGGESHVEYWIAHQYLAIAQETGAWKYPQTFFVGGVNDMLDRFVNKATAESAGYGTGWMAYTDLADYLEGKKIENLETDIPVNTNNKIEVGTVHKWETSWTVPKSSSGLSSIRLDFKDPSGSYWTGSVVVHISRPDGSSGSSFKHRAGPDTIIPSYNSVFVPLADKNITEGTLLRITIQKYQKSSWPTILRLIAAKYEPTYIANPLFEEISSSSQSNTPGTGYVDNVPSHKGYERGKLTDGKLGPKDGWYWDGLVGWHRGGQFSISIDLGKISTVSKIEVWTHEDQTAAANVPINLVGLASNSCVPYVTGTLELSCMADALTDQQTTTVPNDPTSRLITLPFLDPVASRYVTISGVTQFWNLLDEVQVFDQRGAVISTGSPYKLNPMPGEGNNVQPYGDNARNLVDGVVLPEFIFGSPAFDGIHKPSGSDYVESLWTVPKSAQYAIILLSEPLNGAAVGTPKLFTIQWRNERNIWNGDIVTPMTKEQCGPSPCAKLRLPIYSQVTGIRAFLSAGDWWYMITEISIM